MKVFHLVVFVIILMMLCTVLAVPSKLEEKVVVAINAGGPAHRDVHGVSYAADPSTEGVASDFGLRLDIQRIAPDDQILYQTERYGTEKQFGYQLPLKEDGNYVLVLKFCEVYFRAPNQKVFNVVLNGQRILAHLDIFARVGLATAHDEYISFQVKNKGKTLRVHDKESAIKGGRVSLQFEKGVADNPKINAFYLLKGTISEVPQLPPLAPRHDENEESIFEDQDDEEMEFEESDLGYENERLQAFSTGSNNWVRSGPEHSDPWEEQESQNKMLPVLVALVSSAVSLVGVFFLMK